MPTVDHHLNKENRYKAHTTRRKADYRSKPHLIVAVFDRSVRSSHGAFDGVGEFFGAFQVLFLTFGGLTREFHLKKRKSRTMTWGWGRRLLPGYSKVAKRKGSYPSNVQSKLEWKTEGALICIIVVVEFWSVRHMHYNGKTFTCIYFFVVICLNNFENLHVIIQKLRFLWAAEISFVRRKGLYASFAQLPTHLL